MLIQHNVQFISQEWVGFYMSTEDALLEWVVNIGYLKAFSPSHVQFNSKFMSTFPKSTIGSQFFTLTKMKPNVANATPQMAFNGWIACVRLDSLEERIDFNSVYFLGNLINCSSTLLASGGQRLPPFLPIWPMKGENGSLSKRPLIKKPILHKWHNEMSPPPPLSGKSSGTKLRHKRGGLSLVGHPQGSGG